MAAQWRATRQPIIAPAGTRCLGIGLPVPDALRCVSCGCVLMMCGISEAPFVKRCLGERRYHGYGVNTHLEGECPFDRKTQQNQVG